MAVQYGHQLSQIQIIINYKTIQNAALRTATRYTADTNTQHLHTETKILPIKDHLKLHASQLRQKAQLQSHPLNSLTKMKPSRKIIKLKRPTIFDNENYTTNSDDTTNTYTQRKL